MKTEEPKPWDAALLDVFAEMVADDVKRQFGVAGIRESVRGLAEISGIPLEARERACRELARRLNRDPINQAALKWLPKDWQGGDDAVLHVLALMLWAVWENRLELGGHSPWSSEDELAGQIAAMERWNPAYVMALLQNPTNPEEAEDEVVVDAESIECQEDAESAAAELLESLASFEYERRFRC